MAETPKLPEDFPLESIQRVIQILTSGQIEENIAEFGLHVWWTIGYLERLLIPQPVGAIAALEAQQTGSLAQLAESMRAPIVSQDALPSWLQLLIEILKAILDAIGL